MGRLTPVLLAALVLLAATACGERSEPTGPTVALYPLTVQSATDHPVTVTRPARRIAVLDAPVAEILRDLDAGNRIVMDVPAHRVDFSVLRQARPDLVVASETTGGRVLSRAAAVTHAQVYTAPGDSIRQVERAITQLGLIVGAPVKARALVRSIEARRKAVDARVAQTSPVSVFVDTGFFTTAPDQSLLGDVIREAGGRNVAGEASEAVPVDISELLRLDPDVYMTLSDTGVTLQDLRANRQTRKLRAVENGRFVVVDAALLEPGPRIGEGLTEIARKLHPDAFR